MSSGLKGLMLNDDGIVYPGEYYAELTLIKEDGQEDTNCLSGELKVDGVKTDGGTCIMFSWDDIIVNEAGRHNFQFTVWEKPSITDRAHYFGFGISSFATCFQYGAAICFGD